MNTLILNRNMSASMVYFILNISTYCFIFCLSNIPYIYCASAVEMNFSAASTMNKTTGFLINKKRNEGGPAGQKLWEKSQARYNGAESPKVSALRNRSFMNDYREFIGIQQAIYESSKNQKDQGVIPTIETEEIQEIRRMLTDGGDFKKVNKNGSNALHIAAKEGTPELIRQLISNGLDVNSLNFYNNTPLVLALSYGKIDNAKVLLENKADQKHLASDGSFPLLLAVNAQSKEAVSLCLQYDSLSVHYATPDGRTALHRAVELGNYDIVKLLLEALKRPLQQAALVSPITVNYATNTGVTPLLAAFYYGHKVIAELLVEQGANILCKDIHGFTILHHAAERANYDCVVYAISLGKGKISFDAESSDGRNVLHVAAKNSDPKTFDAWVNEGLSVESLTHDGFSPLILACGFGNVALVKHLVNTHKANPRKKDFLGETILHPAACAASVLFEKAKKQSSKAAQFNEQEARNEATKIAHEGVTFCLEQDCDVLASDRDGWTALHYAAQNWASVETIELLLDHKIPVDARTKGGVTALLMALEAGNLQVAQALIKHNAQILARDDSNRTALHCAAISGSYEAVAFCIDQGVNLFALDKNQWNALHYASESCSKETIDLLLECGLQIDSENGYGSTPLMITLAAGNYEGAKYLIKRGAKTSIIDSTNSTLIHFAVRSSSVECLDISLLHVSDLSSPDNYSWTPLHRAAYTGNPRVVKKLLDGLMGKEKLPKKDLVDPKNDDGLTPLWIALRQGHFSAAYELIKSGASLEACTNDRYSVLQDIARSENYTFESFFRFLNYASSKRLDKKSWLKQLTPQDTNVLLDAVESNSISKIQELIDLGFDINETDTEGFTPLMYALMRGKYSVANALRKMGALFDSKKLNEKKVILGAASARSIKAIELCLELGCNVAVTDANGWNILHYLAKHDLYSVFPLIHNRGLSFDSIENNGWTPLLEALYNKSFNSATVLGELGASWNKTSSLGTIALHFALVGKFEPCVELCLRNASNNSDSDSEDENAFHFVVDAGSLELLRKIALLMPGRITDRNKNGETPLMKALDMRRIAVARELLRISPALAKIKRNDGVSPLELACDNGLVELIDPLVRAGADPNQNNTDGFPLAYQALSIGDEAVVTALAKSGADLHQRDKVGGTALFRALIFAQSEGIELCLEKGINPYAVNQDKWNPFHVLVHIRSTWKKQDVDTDLRAKKFSEQEQFARRLLAEFDVLSMQDIHGWTPLHHAVIDDDVPLVKLFREFGAPLNTYNFAGDTPLSLALRSENVEMLEALVGNVDSAFDNLSLFPRALFVSALLGDEKSFNILTKKVKDLRVKIHQNRSLLHYAAMSGSVALVRNCLERGIKADCTDTRQVTPLHLAALSGNYEVAKVLIENAAPISVPDSSGVTPLLCAAEGGDLELVKLLKKLGARVDAKAFDNSSVLHFAARGGSSDCADYFGNLGIKDEKNDKGEDLSICLQKKRDKEEEKILSQELGAVRQVLTFLKFGQTDMNLYSHRNRVIAYVKKILDSRMQRRFVRQSESNQSQHLSPPEACCSKLLGFPFIDSATYAYCIQMLGKLLKRERDTHGTANSYSSLLHTWSYLTGIPVVRLKHDGDYYYHNKHLKLAENSTLEFAGNSLVESLPNGDELREVDLPADLTDSAPFFLSRGGTRSLSGVNEQQRIAWRLLDDQLVPLEQLQVPVLDSCLSTLLRLNNAGMPLLSHGIVNLLRNTAIYLAPGSQSSRIVASPCSVAATSYLGFQDGLLLESSNNSEGVMERLLGKEIFRRALYISFSEASANGQAIDSVNYVPHYSFSSNLINLLKSRQKTFGNIGDFSNTFSKYLKGDEDQLDQTDASIIELMVEELDEKQLKQPCISRRELVRKLGTGVIFEPDRTVDLSGKLLSDERPFNQDAQEDNDDDNATLEMKKNKRFSLYELMLHLACIDYQTIKRIDLSHNNLSDDDLQVIADRLATNVLPDLEELDLSNNSVTDAGLKNLILLLRRDNFKLLILTNNNLENVLAVPHELMTKVVWLPRYLFQRLSLPLDISEVIKETHRIFYNRTILHEE